jgi:hypothetical protein
VTLTFQIVEAVCDTPHSIYISVAEVAGVTRISEIRIERRFRSLTKEFVMRKLTAAITAHIQRERVRLDAQTERNQFAATFVNDTITIEVQ